MHAGSAGGWSAAEAVTERLEEARELGFLGPGPVTPQVEHARGFARAALAPCGPTVPAGPPSRVVDLGSGGGLPGLVLADMWPETTFVLVEVSARRASFLRRSVVGCGWAGRVEVLEDRAEAVGRDPARRGWADLVVARAFGPPAVAAECAAPLLRVAGRLVVSEPPDGGGGSRWPELPLAGLGLGTSCAVREGFGYRVSIQIRPCPDRFPRRVGVPAKRPLF
jgi:16S rRNA (guanine527-N7)-methyltransferase